MQDIFHEQYSPGTAGVSKSANWESDKLGYAVVCDSTTYLDLPILLIVDIPQWTSDHREECGRGINLPRLS